MTSPTTPRAAPAPPRLPASNRDQWRIEGHHCILDWNWDEDRGTLRTGH